MLTEFLSANLTTESQHERVSDVTVEMEEPLLVGTVAGISEQEKHSSEKPSQQTTASREKASAATSNPATEHLDADNRRAQKRYACRLGAEVYRTGTSVPNHCCLTDLSSGGCYLEVPLPFPTGSSVEILVRTYEMKLRLRGQVLASHPGYGMGVAFELKTKEERENVKKLTDFVAATTEPSK